MLLTVPVCARTVAVVHAGTMAPVHTCSAATVANTMLAYTADYGRICAHMCIC